MPEDQNNESAKDVEQTVPSSSPPENEVEQLKLPILQFEGMPETKPQNNQAEVTPQNPPNNSPMEVHHHGHVHDEKKWKEYIFQFLMLFLAVFCGFLG
ncbi:MAG: hypothetical protein ABR503_09370 [Chitinophagaceae bacterium]